MLFEAVDSNASLQGITVTGGRLNVFNGALLASNFIVPVELVSMRAENTEMVFYLRGLRQLKLTTMVLKLKNSFILSFQGTVLYPVKILKKGVTGT